LKINSETQQIIEKVAEKYQMYRRKANSYIPHRTDKNSEFLDNAKLTLEYAQKAENARLSFVKICRENNWMCECWKRKNIGTWKMSNEHKTIPEDNNYIYVNPETPCPNCNKLVPNFSEVK
jgi:hypothetical protein